MDIVERLENSLKVNPTHMLRLGDIAEAGSCIKHQRAEIERLRASQERLKSAIEFAHSEGFQWPSDPMAEFAVNQQRTIDPDEGLPTAADVRGILKP